MSSPFCTNCGMQLQATQRFCGDCGTKVEVPPVATPRSWSTSPPPRQDAQKLSAKQAAPKKRLAGWLKLLLVLIVVSCLLASGAFYRFSVYNHYQLEVKQGASAFISPDQPKHML